MLDRDPLFPWCEVTGIPEPHQSTVHCGGSHRSDCADSSFKIWSATWGPGSAAKTDSFQLHLIGDENPGFAPTHVRIDLRQHT